MCEDVRLNTWKRGALEQKRWRVKRQAGNPPRRASGAAGQGLPLQHPHSTLCSPLRHFYWFVRQIWPRVSLALPLSTAILTVACNQRLDTGFTRWQARLLPWTYFCTHICFSYPSLFIPVVHTEHVWTIRGYCYTHSYIIKTQTWRHSSPLCPPKAEKPRVYSYGMSTSCT